MINLPTPCLSHENELAIIGLAPTIINSPDHSLHQFFTLLPSSLRYDYPYGTIKT